MPIQYPLGIRKEHIHVREKCGIFDVSHMGQFKLSGEGSAQYLSRLTPANFSQKENGSCSYTVFTNEDGGILDDLIVSKISDTEFYIVVNAACKLHDEIWMKEHLPPSCTLEKLEERALIAIQGPQAEAALQELVQTDLPSLQFMQFTDEDDITIFRCGYTGEDGFEVSIPQEKALDFWNKLNSHKDVEPIGLGARDSLRLEAGLPLYGHDLDQTTSPVEASISWIISSEHDTFIGHERILNEKVNGAKRKRVGVLLKEKGIAREGCILYNLEDEEVGVLTSGAFNPTDGQAIGQGYIKAEHANFGDEIYVSVRNKKLKAEIHKLRFLEK